MEVSDQLLAPAALSRKKNLGTHYVGGWLGPSVDVGDLENKKSLAPAGNLTAALPACS
jgi:hypothetical protein